MKIYIGSDHAGYELKNKLIGYLTELGHIVEDKGAHSYDEGDDYPDFIKPVAIAVSQDRNTKGLVIGGTGQGEAMCANRVHGVRAALWYGGDIETLRLSREHNDANVLSLGARLLNQDDVFEVVKVWLETPFSGDDRHVRRIAKLDKSE